MAESPDIKKKLLGWMQGALKKVEAVVEAAVEAPPASKAAPRPAKTGSLSGLPARGSGTLPPINRPPVTGPLGNGTDKLIRGSQPLQGASRPEAATTGPLRSPEEEAAESKKRLAFVMAYMKDPNGDPAFLDKPLVYKILSEERTFQQRLAVQLDAEFKLLPPSAEALGLTPEEAAQDDRFEGLEARRAELEQRLGTARNRQSQLFALLKKLTGVKGKTGGTGFLAPANLPQRRADDSVFDVEND